MMASKLFFPQGVSKYGALEDMKIELGNYAQESVSLFVTSKETNVHFQNVSNRVASLLADVKRT